MKIDSPWLALAFCLLVCNPAFGVELRSIDVRTGTDGLARETLVINNLAAEPIICNAQIAHWYSVVLAKADPDKIAEIEFWRDPETGTLSVLNDSAENMPVEAAWCGLAGQAYKTRSALKLERQPGAGQAHRSVSCHSSENRLLCR